MISEAENLENALTPSQFTKHDSQIGSTIIETYILTTGKPRTVAAMGWSVEEAYEKAMFQIPEGATILDRKELGYRTDSIHFEAYDDVSAQKEAEDRLASVNFLRAQDRKIESVKIVTPGQSKFFGLVRKPNKYAAKTIGQFKVEVTFTEPAKVRVVAGDRLSISSWSDLLKSLRSLSGKERDDMASLQATPLFAQFPFQVLYVMMENKLENDKYFENIPFCPITREMVDRAEQYISNPWIRGSHFFIYAVAESDFCQPRQGGNLTFFGNRYKSMPGGNVSRRSVFPIDQAICQTSSYLSGRKVQGIQELPGHALEAIKHYAELPIVNYFLTLPSLHKFLAYGKISPDDLLMVYMGAEGLFLELYGALHEGEVITDQMFVSYVRKHF
jgi:hypothetical protein